MIHCFSKEELKELIKNYNVPKSRYVWAKHNNTNDLDYVHLFKPFNNEGYYDVQDVEGRKVKKEKEVYKEAENENEIEQSAFWVRGMLKNLRARKKSK